MEAEDPFCCLRPDDDDSRGVMSERENQRAKEEEAKEALGSD